jgi:hypothetical protein
MLSQESFLTAVCGRNGFLPPRLGNMGGTPKLDLGVCSNPGPKQFDPASHDMVSKKQYSRWSNELTFHVGYQINVLTIKYLFSYFILNHIKGPVMKKMCAIICFLISFFMISLLSAESYWSLSLEKHSENSTRPETEKQARSTSEYKDDLGMGYFIAIVPGFVVHGAGNFYGGRKGTGLTLLSLEIVSIYGILRTELNGWMGNNTGEDDEYGIIKIGSIILFFGTWIYDILTVDSAIKNKYENRKVRISVLKGIEPKYENKYTILLLNLTIDL